MNDDRRINPDGLLRESSRKTSIRSALRKRTSDCLRSTALPITMMTLLVLILLVVLFLFEEESDPEPLEPDQVFAQYGSPPEDQGQEWSCSKYVGGIRCWDGTYTYLYVSSSSGWSLMAEPEDTDDGR